MKRVVAFILVPVLSGIASADAGPFPNSSRYVPVTITLTVDREYPDHEVLLVGHVQRVPSGIDRVSLSPSAPLVFRSDEDPLRPRLLRILVYVVPKKELERLGQPIPAIEWFNQIGPERAKEFIAGTIGDRGQVGFSDNRNRVEQTYRLEILPEGSRVVLVSENKGNVLVKLGWTGLCCVLPPVAIVWFGFWLARRLVRNRS